MKVLLREQIGNYLREAGKRSLFPAFYLKLTSGLRRGELLILLTFLLLIFAMRPHVLPRWTDENDLYDRIWE